MSFRKYQGTRNTSASLHPFLSFASAEYLFEPSAKLVSRSITITDRREVEVKEHKATPPLSIFGSSYPTAGPDTTRKWESEKVIEIEESYE
jgi:hypothetical protein